MMYCDLNITCFDCFIRVVTCPYPVGCILWLVGIQLKYFKIWSFYSKNHLDFKIKLDDIKEKKNVFVDMAMTIVILKKFKGFRLTCLSLPIKCISLLVKMIRQVQVLRVFATRAFFFVFYLCLCTCILPRFWELIC